MEPKVERTWNNLSAFVNTINNYQWLFLVGIGIATFMAYMELYVIAMALPLLMSSLRISFAVSQWIVLSYSLTLTIMALAVGRLGEIFNKTSLYLLGVLFFTIASLICGFSNNIEILIFGRICQGIGAAIVAGLRVGLITDIIPKQERGYALGIVSTVVTLGVAMGPGLGGFLIEIWGWRSIFFINIPLGFIAFSLLSVSLLSSETNKSRVSIRAKISGIYKKLIRDFDFLEMLLFSVIMGYLILVLENIHNFQKNQFSVIRSVLISILLLILFFAFESKTKGNQTQVKLFRNENIIYCLTLLLISTLIFGATAFISPLFLELVQGISPSGSGFILMVIPLSVALASTIAGKLSDLFGNFMIYTIGLLLMGIGSFSAYLLFNDETPILIFLAIAISIHLGQSIFVTSNGNELMNHVSTSETSTASSLWFLFHTLGLLLGQALAGLLCSSELDMPSNIDIIAISQNIHYLFFTTVCILIVGILLNFFSWYRAKSSSEVS